MDRPDEPSPVSDQRDESGITRDQILDRYRPIRAAIQRVLKVAAEAPKKRDFDRAISEIAPWAEGIDESMIDMITDVALFEPNENGRRAYDRFLARSAVGMSPDDRALAERMSAAWFSMFRVVQRHEVAGVWLDDLLEGERRVWLMDEGLEASALPDDVIGLRVFDAGLFHAAFGIAPAIGDETLGPCLIAKARRAPLPGHTSLAAMVYADHLAGETPVGDEEFEAIEALATIFEEALPALIESSRPGSKAKAGKKPRLGKARTR